jgi:hypothetical protein
MIRVANKLHGAGILLSARRLARPVYQRIFSVPRTLSVGPKLIARKSANMGKQLRLLVEPLYVFKSSTQLN